MDMKLFFTSRPESVREAIALLGTLGGYDIGLIDGVHRVVFPKRFVLEYRHDDPGIGYVATALLKLEHSYDQDRLLKQLTRLFKRMPGVAANLRHPEEIRLQGGKPTFVHWGESAQIRAVINGSACLVVDVDDTGLATLWVRKPEEPYGRPVGKVPPGSTEEELAQFLAA